MSPSFASSTQRPTWALIHTDRFGANIRHIRDKVGPSRAVMAVIKADAYGHGMMPLARVAREAGAAWFGVATVDEGLALQAAGLGLPILVVAPMMPASAPVVVEAGLRVGVGNLAQAEALDQAARRQGHPALAHLKIDTGMGRFGVWHQDLPGVLPDLLRFKGIEWEGVMTHFAESDIADRAFTGEQIARFDHALDICRRAGLNYKIAHAGNSGAVLQHPKAWYDLVRPGVMLYGMLPDPETERTIAIEPVMSLMTAVVDVRRVGKGRTVSYGRTFTARRDSLIALLPIGYGDGYSRALSNKGEVMVRGRRAPIAGRVCMDQIMIDVTDVPGVSVGDPVLMWGREDMEIEGGRRETVMLSAEEIATARGTITYEITCNLTPRVPRVYLK